MNIKDKTKKIEIKCNKEIFSVLLDEDDFFNLKDNKFVIVKQHGFATVNLLTCEETKKRKSLGKILLNTNKNVYLKNRYTSQSKFELDYRKSNLTVNIKDMEGYSEIARVNFYKNKDKIMSARHSGESYKADIAEKIIKSNSGENSYKAKLTEKDILNIRDEYLSGLVTQDSLAKKYRVSRSTISSIVTFKRWRYFHNREKLNISNINIRELSKNNIIKCYLSVNDFNSNDLVYLKEDNLFYYIKKVNDEGLVYMEVRNNNNEILVRSDLLFNDIINPYTKREYSIAYKYPVKTPVSLLVDYVDKLRAYI